MTGTTTDGRTGDSIVDESFLEVRAKLLEVAATLDRIDRASSEAPLSEAASGKRALLQQAIEIVQSSSPERAKELQHLFSRQYESDWRQTFGL